MTYTNSPLVDYKRISPNKTKNRTHDIDTVSIHCVVGQCSVEGLGSIFADPNKEASSNYGIGYDGKIGLYVDEKDRSWCTSSPSNDNRAITIEVASDTSHPYKVTDAAYKSLIKLLVDICKRNGIKKLLWRGDKSLIGQVDKQNMTVHRWFANKACPGDYLYNRHSKIADEVNKQLNVKSDTPTSKPTSSEAVKMPSVVCKVRQGGKWTNKPKRGKPITDITIKATKGSVKYRVHILGGSWLPYVTGYNTNDHNNGYAGNGKTIDAVEVYYTTPSDVAKTHGYLKAKYRVAPLGKNYLDYQYDNEVSSKQDGYAGILGKAFDLFDLKLGK